MIIPVLLLLLFAWTPGDLHAGPRIESGKLQGSHGNRASLPRSCQACHRGMNMRVSGEEGTCLHCHGGSEAREKMVADGYLRLTGKVRLADIGAELRKPYNHPVLTISGVHRQFEALPEEVVDAYRHAECVDCHNPHLVDKGKPFRGLKGKRVGNLITGLVEEYDLCYKCHSVSANLPVRSTNKAEEFRLTNPSFHPVEGEGKNAFVISLKAPYTARKDRPGDVSIISCRDCHGSDDAAAPCGPHGSNYRGLLVAHYELEDGRPESEQAYALCYKCHNRASILGNESFPYHALHIEGNKAANAPGTSCHTCHTAHGSSRYQYLIRFNEDVVRANTSGKLEFRAQGVASRSGSCLLNCHGKEHDPKSY
jgi:hypothetical protein